MIELRFRGWFQARLATDPDPYDEPRGVSGYVHAYVDEPDLDRIITFQPPAFVRRYGPPVGVRIDRVRHDGNELPAHPLLGAPLDLLDQPRFEGRNGVIAEDGMEPIYPFKLEVRQGAFRLRREIVPANPDFPYEEFFASGVEGNPQAVAEATGIPSLLPVWTERLDRLRQDLQTAAEPERTSIQERVAFLQARRAIGFYGALMRYHYALKSAPQLEDADGWLPEAPSLDPWIAEFWLGAWDADALCGYCLGTLTLPGQGELLARRASLRRP
jgi:hypothetical protein